MSAFGGEADVTRTSQWTRGHSRERCALWHSGRDAQRLTFRHGSSRGTDGGRSGLLRYWLYSRMRNMGGGNAVCAQQVVMALLCGR
jgi:hypothetical protein